MIGSIKFGFFGWYFKFFMFLDMFLEFRFFCGNFEWFWLYMFVVVEIYFVWDRLIGWRRGSKYGGFVGVGVDFGGLYYVDFVGFIEFVDNRIYLFDKLVK